MSTNEVAQDKSRFTYKQVSEFELEEVSSSVQNLKYNLRIASTKLGSSARHKHKRLVVTAGTSVLPERTKLFVKFESILGITISECFTIQKSWSWSIPRVRYIKIGDRPPILADVS